MHPTAGEQRRRSQVAGGNDVNMYSHMYACIFATCLPRNFQHGVCCSWASLRWQASQRKGTGFLTAKDLADLPSDDEEEDSPDSPTANEAEAGGCKG